MIGAKGQGMAYRRAKYGLMPIDPEEVAAMVAPGTVARMEPADPRRNDLRDVKRGAERGWRVSEAVKDKALETVMEVLDDWNATNRDRLTAVGAITAMVGQDIRIDQTAAENEPINLLDAINAGQKYIGHTTGRFARQVTPQATSLPSAVTLDVQQKINSDSTPRTAVQYEPSAPGTHPPSVGVHPHVGSAGAAGAVDKISGIPIETLRNFPTSALALEKSGKLPDGTCAALGITDPGEPPLVPSWDDLWRAAPDHSARMDVLARLRRAQADGDEDARFHLARIEGTIR